MPRNHQKPDVDRDRFVGDIVGRGVGNRLHSSGLLPGDATPHRDRAASQGAHPTLPRLPPDERPESDPGRSLRDRRHEVDGPPDAVRISALRDRGGGDARRDAVGARGAGPSIRRDPGGRRTAEERSIDAAVAEYEAALTELAGSIPSAAPVRGQGSEPPGSEGQLAARSPSEDMVGPSLDGHGQERVDGPMAHAERGTAGSQPALLRRTLEERGNPVVHHEVSTRAGATKWRARSIRSWPSPCAAHRCLPARPSRDR